VGKRGFRWTGARDGSEGAEEVDLPSAMPLLAPDQERRTSRDTGPDRADASLPHRLDIVVTYCDFLLQTHTTPAVLEENAH
jgi:hypothetical protein